MRSFYVVVAVLILLSGTISIRVQYVNAGQNGDQFNPFGQDGDQLSPNGSSQGGAGQQDPVQGGSNVEDNSQQTTRIYENPLYSLRVPYPSNWVVDDTEESKVDFAPQIGERPHVDITILPDPKLDASVSMIESIKQVMVNGGDTTVDEEQSTINGRKAYFVSWTGETSTGSTFKNAVIVTQTIDFLYFFQLSSLLEGFENLLPVLNAMFLGSEFSESRPNSQTSNNNLSREGREMTSNNTFQGELGLQGRGGESGQSGDQFDPFGQGGDSLSRGDRADGTPENMSSTTFEKYTSPAGFSVSYPAGSELEELYLNVVYFTFPQAGTAHAAAISNINQLDQFVQDEINLLRNKSQNFELIKSEDLTLSGHPGHTIEYEYTSNGTEFKGKGALAVVNNTGYSVEIISRLQDFENVTPVMNRMLNSFEITQPSPVDNQVHQETQRMQTISTLNFLTYRHPTLGFTIEYPEAPGLEVEEREYGVSFPHNQGTYHALVSGNIGKSLDEFASDLTQGKENYPDFRFIGQTSATVAGHPAIRTEYTYTTIDEGISMHALEYTVLFDGDGYVLSFNTAYPTDAALDDFRAVVQKMLDSFQFPQSGSFIADDNNQQGETALGAEGFGSSGSSGFGQEDDDEGFGQFGPQSPDGQDEQDQNGGFDSGGSQSPSEENDGGGGFDPFG